MELRPGYKQTDVGVIPEEWEVKLLPDVCHFRAGRAHEQHISDAGQYVCVNSKFISTDGKVRKYSSAAITAPAHAAQSARNRLIRICFMPPRTSALRRKTTCSW